MLSTPFLCTKIINSHGKYWSRVHNISYFIYVYDGNMIHIDLVRCNGIVKIFSWIWRNWALGFTPVPPSVIGSLDQSVFYYRKAYGQYWCFRKWTYVIKHTKRIDCRLICQHMCQVQPVQPCYMSQCKSIIWTPQ